MAKTVNVADKVKLAGLLLKLSALPVPTRIGRKNSRIAPIIEALVPGEHHDFEFHRMKEDPDFNRVFFRVQRGLPEKGGKPELRKALSGLYGKHLGNTYFLSIWWKDEAGDLHKVSKGVPTAYLGALPLGMCKDDMINFVRATLSGPMLSSVEAKALITGGTVEEIA